MLLLLTQLVNAAVPEDLEKVKQHVAKKEYDQAMSVLENLDKGTKNLDYLVTAQELAEIYYYLGVVKYFQDGQGLNEWRKALILKPSLAWNEQIVDDSLAWDIFLAIQGEIPHRPKIELPIPVPFGHAKVYVDGVQRSKGDIVPAGRHLLQVECPKGEVVSMWTEFERTIKWTKVCPYKFDVNDLPEEEVADEWDMFGPSFGVSTEETTDAVDPDNNEDSNQAVATSEAENSSTTEPTKSTKTSNNSEIKDSEIKEVEMKKVPLVIQQSKKSQDKLR